MLQWLYNLFQVFHLLQTMLQMFYLDVLKVDLVLHVFFTLVLHMSQLRRWLALQRSSSHDVPRPPLPSLSSLPFPSLASISLPR
jgi:hypothetical protein